jgi:serine/threonine protein phosphatase PrpC
MLKAVGITHEGLERDHNEDSILVNKKVGLFAVADGMGGHAFGEKASRMAVQALNANVESVLSNMRKKTALDGNISGNPLLEAIRASNSHIYDFAQSLHEEKPGSTIMGTTLSTILVKEKKLFVAHVGDSRIYRFRENMLEKLTRDHSEAQDLIDAGFLKEEEAEEHPSSHVLTRAIGVAAAVTPDLMTCGISEGDQFLIASDGLFRVFDEKMVQDILCQHGSLREKAHLLITGVLEGGAPDNVSVVIVDPSKNNYFKRILFTL